MFHATVVVEVKPLAATNPAAAVKWLAAKVMFGSSGSIPKATMNVYVLFDKLPVTVTAAPPVKPGKLFNSF